MALTDITSQFQPDGKGGYSVEIDSCTGVLQVEREKSSSDRGIEIFSYLPGMTPYSTILSSKLNFQVDLEFHRGMKILIVSSTRVVLAKLLKDE